MADKKKQAVLPWGMSKEALQPNSVKVNFLNYAKSGLVISRNVMSREFHSLKLKPSMWAE